MDDDGSDRGSDRRSDDSLVEDGQGGGSMMAAAPTDSDDGVVGGFPQDAQEPSKGDVSGGGSDVVRRRLRTLTFGRRYSKAMTNKGSGAAKDGAAKKRSGSKGAPWGGFKFNYRLKRSACGGPQTALASIPEPNAGCESCVCTGYRRTEEHHLGAGVVIRASSSSSASSTEERSSSSFPISSSSTPAEQRQRRPPYTRTVDAALRATAMASSGPMPFIDLCRFNPDDYPIEDCDERARAARARELEEGVELPPGYRPVSTSAATPVSEILHLDEMHLDELFAGFQSRLTAGARFTISARRPPAVQELVVTAAGAEAGLLSGPSLVVHFDHPAGPQQMQMLQRHRTVHTQVDYIHCLVPDLREITNCSFYWGKMDRYEAERLLERKPEGTFLLRDSAQEEYLFSVSFRRYGRSLHARVEQWNHRFSFDSHDPGVFASDTVCGLIDHYKDPSCCMFFEPMLTLPLHRTFPFPLQHLCRSVISEGCKYDGVNSLRLPKTLKAYLKEYHYKQRVRVRRFEDEH